MVYSLILPGALALVLLLLPFAGDAPSGGWALSLASLAHDLPWRIYHLLKALILWVPLGFVAALSARLTWRTLGLGAWVLAAGMGLGTLLAGSSGLQDFQSAGLVEILALFPGLALGYWLGQQSALPGSLPVAPLVPPGEGAPGAPAAEPARVRRDGRDRGGAASWGGWIAGLLLLAGVVWTLTGFPRVPGVLGAGLLVYALAFWRWPPVGLVVVPAALPLLDLAPWTGRFVLDEFDLLMLVTLAVMLMRGPGTDAARGSVRHGLLLGVVLAAYGVSLIIGLWPWPAWDANAGASYWSPYNALRVAKGLAWGGVLFLLLRALSPRRDSTARWLALGMGLGLLGVGLVGAWEHAWFVQDAAQHTYRIVSTFSSMHTGGGHIEAYLVAALPFLWLASARFKYLVLTAPVMLLTAYVMLYTVARGGVLALAVVLAILLLASTRLALRSRGRGFIAPAIALVAVGLVLAGGVGTGYLQQRFSQTGEDWQTRMNHWASTLDLADDTVLTQLFGMGLGSFPRVFQERGPIDQQPASFGFGVEGGNTYFRLGTGATVYYAQRIPFRAGQTYRLLADVRSRTGDTRLEIPVCEKQMLNSRQCEWSAFNVQGDGQWHPISHTLHSDKVGVEHWTSRPPVELFLYQPGQGRVVDVDNLRLLDPQGRNVLCNGDFAQGGDCWFFKTHSHLPWHIKNLWVHVLFEQGWVGLLLFLSVTGVAVYRLARAGLQGQRLAWALLASLAGMHTVGLFDSLLDAPRLATLVMAWTLLGALHDWQPRRRETRHGARRRHRPPTEVPAP